MGLVSPACVFRIVLLTLFWGWPTYAQKTDTSDDEILRKIEHLIKRFEKDTTHYRWQSKSSAENLLKHGKYEGAIHKYFMGMNPKSDGLAAGLGIYNAESLNSSQTYAGTSGSLVQVNIKKGTPFIDLTSEAVNDALRKIKSGSTELYPTFRRSEHSII